MTKKIFRRAWNAFDGLAGDTLWAGFNDGSKLINAYISFQILQLSFSADLYGNYLGLFGLLGVLGALSHAGVGLSGLQRVLGDQKDPTTVLRNHVSLSLMLAILGVGLTAVAGGFVFDEFGLFEIIVMATAELAAVGLVGVSAGIVQGSVGFPAATRIRMGIVVVRFIVTTTLFFTGLLSMRTLALGFLLGFCLYAVLILGWYVPKHGIHFAFTRPSRQSVSGSIHLSSSMAAGRVQTDGDKYLLNAFGFKAIAGPYGAAYRGLIMANMPLIALEAAAFQRFLPRHKGEKGVHWRQANRLTALMFAAALVVMVGMYVTLPIVEVILIRGDGGGAGAERMLPYLLPLLPVMALSGTPLNGLIGLGRLRERAYIFFGSASLSVAFYLVLIPMYDWVGALVATYMAETVLVLLGWPALWYYQKKHDEAVDAMAAAESAGDSRQGDVSVVDSHPLIASIPTEGSGEAVDPPTVNQR